MSWFDYVLIAGLAIISVIEWDRIGKPRAPITKSQAVADIAINLVLIAFICWH